MVSNIHGLEYNSKREDLTFSEYGRIVQKLIQQCKEIEDRDKRQSCAEGIIELMNLMNPQNKNVIEYRMRLWRHFFVIADYDIDVTPIEGVSKDRTIVNEVKAHLTYPQSEFRFRHYGNIIQKMIDKAIALEDEEKKMEFSEIIASYMKLAYRTWNQEHYVNDDIIKNDLIAISKGKLKIPDDVAIENITPVQFASAKNLSPKNNKQGSRNNNKPRKAGQNNNNNNNRNKKR